jgi:hypothetical protein
MFVVWVITYACTSWEKFKSNVKLGMLAAKQMSKDQILKNGREQQEWVVKFVFNKLPKTWVKFLGEEKTRYLIQRLYNTSLDLIDDGKLNNSI